MQLTEAHVVPLLVGMTVFALLLGLIAYLLAMRLMLERNQAANDATFDHKKIAYRTRRSVARAALRLVRARASSKPGGARPYLPEVAHQSARKRPLKRVS